MDLIPKPDQVVSAASNVAHKMLYGGLADLRPMPRTLIDDGPLRELYHYRPQKQTRTTGDPILLVTPLAAPALCFDLRRGCSLVEHFVQEGRPTYLVEYGEISFKDRRIGMEHWIEEVLPEAIKMVSNHAGGRPVHVVGWSLGGVFAVLTAADQPQLPIASLTVVGSPFDVTKVPLVAPLRPLLRITDGGVVTQLYRALGGAPKPLVRRVFQLSSGAKIITKPLATLQHLDDAEWLAQIEAVDRFTANMIAYPGRTFGQLYHRTLKANELQSGVVDVNGRTVRVAEVTAPVIVFAGNTDGIAPIESVRRLTTLLAQAAEVRFEIVPGGHLGMLTGRAARRTTWVIMDEWIAQYSTPEDRPTTPRRKSQPRSRPVQKPAPQKTAKKVAKKPPPAVQVSPSRSKIGSNAERRFTSGPSRDLARKRRPAGESRTQP